VVAGRFAFLLRGLDPAQIIRAHHQVEAELGRGMLERRKGRDRLGQPDRHAASTIVKDTL
jgi:hypothetical protein